MSEPAITITQLAIDLSSPEFSRDPYPVYARLRRDHPVFLLQPAGSYVLTRHEDVFRALTDYETFGEGASAVTQPDWLSPDCRHQVFLITQDPPYHRKLRSAVSKSFNDDTINGLAPFMRETARGLCAPIARNGCADFMADFAFPYVGSVLGRLFGLNLQEHSIAELRHWVELIISNTPQRPPQSHIDAVETATRALFRYLDKNIEQHRRCPFADGTSDLIQARINDRPFSDEELRNALLLFVSAGLESTSQMLGGCVAYMLQHPAILSRLQQQPALIPAFIEECLRFSGPTHSLQRTTRRPVKLHGITIPAKAAVYLMLAAANRDERQFPNPDLFDLTRPNNKRHVAFGSGPHLCIGAPLARVEVKIALETLIPVLNRLTCPDNDELEWRNTMSTRCLTALPIQLR